MEELWNGFRMEEFLFEDHVALVVLPNEGTANGHLLMKTEYWGAFPATEAALVEKGFHLCYVKNDNRWGTDADVDRKARFVRFVSEKYGLGGKVVPVGMSCGGLHAVKFAGKYPEMVSCMYLDAPVFNYMSCPCGFGVGEPLDEGRGIDEAIRALGLSGISELICYRDMPMDKIPVLVENKIPVIMVAGDADTAVPYPENGILLKNAYTAAGLELPVYIKEGCAHHPHGLADLNIVVDFVLQHV